MGTGSGCSITPQSYPQRGLCPTALHCSSPKLVAAFTSTQCNRCQQCQRQIPLRLKAGQP